VVPGDELEVQGPIGGWFVWRADSPAVGVAGGSGVVPFVAMLRHAGDRDRRDLLRLAVSARTLADLPYRDELRDHGALIALTREDDPVGGRARGRLRRDEVAGLVGDASAVDGGFVCGSAAFAEGASMLLMDSGVPVGRIRVERFGPSG
jgi:ferredoxin-NADP reductase